MTDGAEERLRRLLGGNHLASLRKRLRRRFERVPLNGVGVSAGLGLRSCLEGMPSSTRRMRGMLVEMMPLNLQTMSS